LIFKSGGSLLPNAWIVAKVKNRKHP